MNIFGLEITIARRNGRHNGNADYVTRDEYRRSNDDVKAALTGIHSRIDDIYKLLATKQ